MIQVKFKLQNRSIVRPGPLLQTALRRTLRVWGSNTLAPHCNTLQHTATHCNAVGCPGANDTLQQCNTLRHTATHCNTLQRAATHCNTLQHAATCCNMLQHAASHYNVPRHHDTATRCNTLQHTALHCISLHYTTTRYITARGRPFVTDLGVSDTAPTNKICRRASSEHLRIFHQYTKHRNFRNHQVDTPALGSHDWDAES